jgi:cytochrome c
MKALVTTALAAALLAATPAMADQALAQKNACMSCHGIDKKIVGPGLKDISKKYKGDASAAAKLEAKVKKGGGGVWGSVPMPPNPQVKDEDIHKIVAWMLTL